MKFQVSVLLSILILGFLSVGGLRAAEPGLIIHAAELGIGKFHRYDNSVHAYSSDNIWANYALDNDAPLKTPQVRENQDGSITIFFSNLEELLKEIQKVSARKNAKVQVLNINAHGMPGAMWFPKDETTMNGTSCGDWVTAAHGDDKANYEQYYSPVLAR